MCLNKRNLLQAPLSNSPRKCWVFAGSPPPTLCAFQRKWQFFLVLSYTSFKRTIVHDNKNILRTTASWMFLQRKCFCLKARTQVMGALHTVHSNANCSQGQGWEPLPPSSSGTKEKASATTFLVSPLGFRDWGCGEVRENRRWNWEG